jgi:hypothetical protein
VRMELGRQITQLADARGQERQGEHHFRHPGVRQPGQVGDDLADAAGTVAVRFPEPR